MGFRVRALTSAEAALAREAFGAALRLNGIRLIGWPFRRAFVAGRWFGRDWIVWPRRELVEDLAAAPNRLQGVLIHELTHVWQAQQGVNLLWAKLKAGDTAASYAYEATASCRWDGLNIVLYVAAQQEPGEPVSFFNDSIDGGSISMTGVRIG